MQHERNHDPNFTRHQPGRVRAASLAVLMHVGLLLGLMYSVHWKTTEPQSVSAELWSSLPAAAAQPAPPPIPEPTPKPEPTPEPPVVKPDIVLDVEKKPPKPEPKPEPKEVHKEQPKQKQEPKIRIDLGLPQAQDTPRERQGKDALRDQILGPATSGGRPGGTDSGYGTLLRGCIKPHMIFNASEDGPNYLAIFRVSLLPTGEQAGPPQLLKSSGNSQYDAAVERAIRRCDPFPRPKSGVYDRTVDVQYSPRDR